MWRGRSGARALRAVGWTMVGLAGAALLACVAVPLVVRGPILSGVVAYRSKTFCGSVEVRGGHVGLGLVPALLFQRPFPVALDGVRIREPDGRDFFRAAALRARVAVLRNPWRVVVERASIAGATWQLVDKGLGEPITEALTRIPAAGRAFCNRPPPSAVGSPTPGPKVTVRALQLRNVSVRLSFPDWAVTLDGVDARGSLDVRATESATWFLFDARDIVAARGGSLRIGATAESLTPEVPFDRISIPRVQVSAAAPKDLRLEVEAARTDDAVLSGRALFTNVFVPDTRKELTGMDVEARWTAVGQALQHSPAWSAVGQRLARLHADLHTSLHGPLDALLGTASVAGRGVSARAQLLPRERYALELRFDDLDTATLLPRGQRARLAGRLDGHLAINARLAKRPSETEVSLDSVELALARDRARDDGLPRRWVVSHTARPRAPDELRVTLGAVALEAQVLRMDPVRVDAPAVLWAGALRAERAKGARGFLLRARSQPGSRVTVAGETFVPPPLLAARIDPDRDVSVEPFSMTHAGGGTIDAGGTVRFAGPLDVSVAIRAYPLARVPGLASVSAPDRHALVRDVLRGRLDAELQVGGRAREPSLSGSLALTDVRWAGRRLGGGRVALEGIRDGTRFAGRLLDGIDARGSLRLHAHAEDFAAVTLRDLPVGAWLPRPLAKVPVRASGEIAWHPGAGGAPQRMTAVLALRAPGVTLDASGHLTPDERGVNALEASLRGTLDGHALGPWLPGKGAGSGSASLSGQVAGPLSALQYHGVLQLHALTLAWPRSPFPMVRLDGPLAIEGRTLTVGPLVARFLGGGWVSITGPNGAGGGRVVLATDGAPLPVSDVQLIVRAAGLRSVRPIAGLWLAGLGLNVRVTETDQTTLRLVGDVHVGHDLFELADREKTSGGAGSARRPSFADHVWLRLRLLGPDRAVTVDVPHAPDVTIDAYCLVEGPLSAPVITGAVEGHNLYSRAALAVADWFNPRNLRKCDVGPRPQPH